MFWKKTLLNKKIALICDIGSASVGISICDFASKIPNVLLSTRIPISIQNNFNATELESLATSFFNEAVKLVDDSRKKNFLSQFAVHIDVVHIFFSSPWYVAKNSSVQVVKEKPFLLDQHELEEIIRKEEKEFQDDLRNTKTIVELGDIAVIERELLSVKLNGYETKNPILKKATDIDLSLFMSVAPHRFIQNFFNKLSSTFHTTQVFAHAFPLAVYRSMLLVNPHEKRYLFLDIAGEMTDIIMVYDGIIQYSGSFSLGRNELVREISRSLSEPFEVVLSLLSLYSNKSLDDEMTKKIDSAVQNFFKNWRNEIEQILKTNNESTDFPQRVFVTVDDDVSFVFLRALKNATADERSVFQLTNTIVQNAISYDKHVIHDPFLALEAISVQYFLQK